MLLSLKNMKKIALLLLGVLIILFIGYYYFADDLNESSITGNVIAGSGSGELKTIVVTGENFKFYIDGVENPEIKVKEGDKVRVEFKSTDSMPHDFVIDEFGATEQVKGEATTFVEFTADKKGEYEYYCSVGKHRANGMFGKFIVE